MKAKNFFIAIKFIGLVALIVGVFRTGNDFIILAMVAALLFFLIGDNSDHLLISKLMFAGAVIGLVIIHSVVSIVNTSYHKGPGYVDYGSGVDGDYGGSDNSGEPDVEKVSESEYKQQEYSMNGVLLGFGLLSWFWVAKWANEESEQAKAKIAQEKSWTRMILNPDNVQEIRRHPENYRDDFKEWIKEIKPDLLLPTKGETQNQPPQQE
jgi:hypothetical protein